MKTFLMICAIIVAVGIALIAVGTILYIGFRLFTMIATVVIEKLEGWFNPHK